MKQLDKNYSPKDFENRIYADWEEKGYFRAKADKSKKPYCIVIPPPNITGQLHIGHALDNTLQDILIRWKRMQGYSALWLPGTDHASIATEAKIVAAMKEEGLTKDDVGREGFLERAWEWRRLYGGTIIKQLKKLGASCDWERERFTMDEGCSKAVQKVFIDLYNEGLIYRGERVINWCPNCKTSISDVECEYEEKDGLFWHINYPVSGEEGAVLEIATTRPETLLGDTAVAVHPDDDRYKHLVGKTVTLPLMNREIPIIADEYVDMEFGTGAVKITPAHDPNDFEVGARHNLPLINVMDDSAVINENGGKYAGMERYAARKAVVRDLEESGFLVKTEPHKHNVGGCQRCGTVVEPRASLQWFVAMNGNQNGGKSLAQPAIDVVKNGRLNWVSKRFENVYMQWMENIRDWCVSRQLWWGHRIPAYYCQNEDCGHEMICAESPQKCEKCGGSVVQDDDTLDTWFSSALWPFSTLGFPPEHGEPNPPELDYFYPTGVIVPAYDIIPFWVARMIFMGLKFMNDVPFKDVFIHGLIRDEQGRKMSKTLGNGVDPLDVIEKFGADALRLTTVFGVSQDSDVRWSESKVTAARNFANKLWNAARYVFMQISPETDKVLLPEKSALAIEDKWILSKFNRLAKEVTANLEAYDLGVAVGKVHDFIWNVYCDWYIELTKSRTDAQPVLLYVMEGMLNLLHPFMPFITEEIWQSMPHSDGESESIMVSKWREYDPNLDFPEEEADFGKVTELIGAIRARRGDMNVPPSKRVSLTIETADAELFKSCKLFFEKLAGCNGQFSVESGQAQTDSDSVVVVTAHARAFIPMGELIDREKETARLQKELEKADKDVEFINKKLSNEGFITKAPAAQVENERAKLAEALEKRAGIEKSLNALK